MKIWTLVWFLISPINEDGKTEWVSGFESNLTQAQCIEMLAEQNVEYEHMQANGDIAGFEIYCKEDKP